MTTGVLAEGTLYVDQLVAGVSQGLEQWPGLAKFEIKSNSKIVESKSKDKGKYGQVVAAAGVAEPDELTIMLTEVSGKALAAALRGSVSAYSQGSGTVTDQVVVAKLGKFVELGKRNIVADSVELTNSAGSTTYVLGTDYRVNYAMGWLEILAAGDITDAQSLKADYAYGAVSGEKVVGATVVSLRGRLVLDGTNLMDGKGMEALVHEANLVSDGSVDLMSDKPVEVTLKGRMITPTGYDSPYEVVLGKEHS